MIELKITGETPQEVMDKLAAFATNLNPATAPSTPKAKPQKPAKTPADSPAEDIPAKAETPPAPVPAAPAVTYTLEQVRAKGLAAARAHGQPAIKALLEELGAANMTGLAPEQYASFMERLDGLGDGNA